MNNPIALIPFHLLAIGQALHGAGNADALRAFEELKKVLFGGIREVTELAERSRLVAVLWHWCEATGGQVILEDGSVALCWSRPMTAPELAGTGQPRGVIESARGFHGDTWDECMADIERAILKGEL